MIYSYTFLSVVLKSKLIPAENVANTVLHKVLKSEVKFQGLQKREFNCRKYNMIKFKWINIQTILATASAYVFQITPIQTKK